MTAGDLGSLVVSITTNLESLNKGLAEAEKVVKNSSGKIIDITNKIGKSLTVVGVAITGAFALMTKSVLSYNDELYRLSQITGLSVETLSRLKYVAEQNESSLEAVTTGLKFLSRNMYEAASGSKEAENKFASLGIAVTNADGTLRHAEDVLFEVADKFKGLSNETTKSALAMEIFGRSGTNLIPILNLGADGIRRAWEEADRLGITLTTKNAKALDEFSDNIKKAKDSILGLWITIVNNIMPTLDRWTKKITEAIIKFREFAKEHPQLTSNIINATMAFGLFAAVLGPLLLIITNVISNIAILTLAAKTLEISLMPIFVILGQIAAVGASAFVGWQIGRLIGEVTGLDNALSGPDGLFMKMWLWLDRIIPKLKEFANNLIIGTRIGLGIGAGIPATEQPEGFTGFGGGITTGAGAGGSFEEESEEIKIINYEKIQELIRQNEEYYDLQLQLRELDLERVISSIQQQLANEILSIEQRKALEQNLTDFKQQKRIEDATQSAQTTSYISSTISSNLARAIVGVQSFSEAWKSIWQNMAIYLIEKVLQKIIDKILEIAALKAVLAFIGLETGGSVSASGHKLPIPSAQQGLFIEGPPGPVPVLIHPPEVILPLEKFKRMQGNEVVVNYYHYGDIKDEIDKEELISDIGKRIKTILRES